MNLYDTLKARTHAAAQTLVLPLGWEGEPFVPPHASHLRGQIVFAEQRTASLGVKALTKLTGRIEIKVVVKAGEDSLAVTLADQLARLFPRGESLLFENGTGTITTPQTSAPQSDGKRTFAVVNVNFYAFQSGD